MAEPSDKTASPSTGGASSDHRELSDEIAQKWDPERLLQFVARRAGKGEALDYATRSKFESRLGADFSKVRIITGEFAERVTAARNAEAITVGGTGLILMRGSATYSPITRAGQALLAHELTHVAQAQRGIFAAGTATAPLATDEHELEAEQVEAEIMQGGDAAPGEGGEEGEDDAAKEKRKKVIERTFELMDQDAWVRDIRDGDALWRA